MKNGHFQQNFSDLIHLLAECRYNFSALTTMLFISSDPRQGNGVTSPRQRYIINQISQVTTSTAARGIYQHTSLLPLFTVHRRTLSSSNNLPSMYGNRIYQTLYIKYISRFLFKFSSCNVIQNHWTVKSNLTLFISNIRLLCRRDARMAQQ